MCQKGRLLQPMHIQSVQVSHMYRNFFLWRLYHHHGLWSRMMSGQLQLSKKTLKVTRKAFACWAGSMDWVTVYNIDIPTCLIISKHRWPCVPIKLGLNSMVQDWGEVGGGKVGMLKVSLMSWRRKSLVLGGQPVKEIPPFFATMVLILANTLISIRTQHFCNVKSIYQKIKLSRESAARPSKTNAHRETTFSTLVPVVVQGWVAEGHSNEWWAGTGLVIALRWMVKIHALLCGGSTRRTNRRTI